jgi:subtilisin family serine protease
VRVAVVDSGIATMHPHVGAVASGVCFVPAASGEFGDRHGHGTAVAAAIREKVPHAQLLAVKVFDRVLSTSAAVLAQGIHWAADHGAQLINLSLGTPNEEHRATLASALAYATQHGALVVAALESDGHAMLPGSLPGAVAVRLDAQCPRDALIVDDHAPHTLAASGYPRPIPGVPPERNLFGISFAVANTTGFLARLLEDQGRALSVREILAELTR